MPYGCRASHIRFVLAAVTLLAGACRDEAPPLGYPENLGSESRPLGPMPVSAQSMSEKLVTGRSEIKALDFDRTGPAHEGTAGDEAAPSGAPAPPNEPAAELPALPQPTTPDFPETTKAVHALITAYNNAAKGGEVEKLGPFYVEDQRPDVIAALKISVKALDRVERLMAGLEKAKPGASASIKALLPAQGKRESMFMMQLASLTPESETRAIGKLGAMYHGEEVRFRKVDEAWLIDANGPKLLSEAQAGEKMLSGLDEVIDGLNSGAMDLPTAQQKLMKWMAQMGAAAAPPQTPPAEPEPAPGGRAP